MRNSIARTITTLRKIRGLTQRGLAAEMALTQPVIARWESGKASPNNENLQRLAIALGTTVEALLAGENDPYGSMPQVREDDELVELFSQAHRLEGRDRDALKAVLEAMLTRSRVQEAIGSRRIAS